MALMAAVLDHDGLVSWGCYNPRNVAGTSTRSLHAEGRAIDVHPVDSAAGQRLWELCHRMVDQHVALGVQQIIWDRRSWRVGRGWRDLPAGTNMHTDHAHIELTWAAAFGLDANTARHHLGDDDLTPEQATQLAQVHKVLIQNRVDREPDAVPPGQDDLATPILADHHRGIGTAAAVAKLPTLPQIRKITTDAIMANQAREEQLSVDPDSVAADIHSRLIELLTGG